MGTAIEMTELSPPEKSRIYQFPGGNAARLENVTHILVRPSGSHRLRTADGKLHIIPPTWIHIEIDATEWTL